VRRRADEVRKIGKRLSDADVQIEMSAETSITEPSIVTPCQQAELQPADPDLTATGLTEEDLTQRVCELVRVNSRISGKAPLDPPELKRHDRLENIRAFVDDARKKKSRHP
jgi:hypothetical protein